MDCYACCHVKNYDLSVLKSLISEHYDCSSFSDVLQVNIENDGQMQHVFFFSYGSIVFWGMDVNQRDIFIKKAKPSAGKPEPGIDEEEFSFSYGDVAKISHKFLQLPGQDSMIKLSVSHAIAQSVKLGTFENNLEKVIKESKHIPKKLAQTGKQPYSRSKLRQKMGQLYLERSAINLHTDLLDEPEFFWDYDEYEPVYSMMRRYLDIPDRLTIINQKLEVVGDLYQMLSEELSHSHFSRLEWIIIWLIAIEIAVTIYITWAGL